MKTSGLIVVLLCWVFSASASGPFGRNADTLYCLQVEGKVNNADEGVEDCKVELLVGSEVVDSIMLKGRKKFKFDLKRNLHYSIRISKPGFEPKTVCVHTWLNEITESMYKFYFETTMFHQRTTTLPVTPGPIAKIYYDEKKGCFYYSRMNAYSSQKCEHTL